MKSYHLVSGFLILFFLGFIPSAQTVLRVDSTAPPGGNGTSWATAFDDLQGALDAAPGVPSPVEVWIAAGTYVPSVPTDPTEPRTVLFLLPADVSLHGGFAGDEASLEERSAQTNPTILSGDVLGDDAPGFLNRADNALRVLQTGASATPIVVERLTITGGNADGVVDRAGGLYVGFSSISPHVEGVTFVENEAVRGGAFSTAIPCSLNACTFRSNRASANGGAIALDILLDWITITNSLFHDNEALCGGAVHAFYAGVAAANCTFVGNSATSFVGGALAEGTPGHLALNNCIFWLNADPMGIDEGAQLWGVGLGSPSGTFLEHCNVSGWTGVFGGTGNHGSPPMFVDPVGPDGIPNTGDEDFRPGPTSPNLDTGRNQLQVHPFLPSFTLLPAFDLAGTARILDGDRDGTATVDIGAFERRPGRLRARRNVAGAPLVNF